MIRVYDNDKVAVTHQALLNMLNGRANPQAVGHTKRILSNTESECNFDFAFIKDALLAGKVVALYHGQEWLFKTESPRDNYDVLVLRLDGEQLYWYTANNSYPGEATTKSTSINREGLQQKTTNLEDTLRFISGASPHIERVASFNKDNLRYYAIDSNHFYLPESMEFSNSDFEEVGELRDFVIAQAVKQDSPVTNQNSTNQEEKTMSNVKTTVSAVTAKNKSAAATVAKIEAGRIGVKQVAKLVTPKLPMMVRGYADTEIGRLVMANLFNFVVTQYAPNNKNALLVADAMLEGAMLEALQSLNVEGMINEVISKVDLSKLTNASEE